MSNICKGGSIIGSEKVKVVPQLAGFSNMRTDFEISILPPSPSTTFLQIYRPRPIPLGFKF
jgi:hypothetical protein